MDDFVDWLIPLMLTILAILLVIVASAFIWTLCQPSGEAECKRTGGTWVITGHDQGGDTYTCVRAKR